MKKILRILCYLVILYILQTQFSLFGSIVLTIFLILLLEIILLIDKGLILITEQQKFIHFRLHLLELAIYAKYSKKDITNMLDKNLYYSQRHYSEEEVQKIYRSLLRMLGKQEDGVKNRTATERLDELDSWITGGLTKEDFFDNE